MVIFDCDGVLVDSERLSHEVLCEMLAEMGVTISFDAAVLRFMGASMPVCRERIAELLNAPLADDFFPAFERRTQAAFAASLQRVPGVTAVLDSLREPYCVASNGTHAKVNFTLGHTGLLERFAGRIFTADDVPKPKPAPDLFLLAARSLGAEPQHTTVVEDTPTGITAAKAAGMHAIGYAAMTRPERLWSAGADAVVTAMAEVQALLAAEHR